MRKKIILIELCDFMNYPLGGHLSFAKQLIRAFGDDLALVGITTDDDTPVGCWTKRNINGVEYDYYSVKRVYESTNKGHIPERIKSYFYVKKHLKNILAYECNNLIIQTPEVFFNFSNNVDLNICLILPGLTNPLSISRYRYGKYFAAFYEKIFFKAIDRASTLLAAADNDAIANFISRGGNRFDHNKLIQFPTRFDESIFYLKDKQKTRKSLNIDYDITLVITSGRLCNGKGWRFMIDAFIAFNKVVNNSTFIFLGDGEDRSYIEAYIEEKHFKHKIILKGRVDHRLLSDYLNSADLFVMGSYAEGWSTSLVEAVACGIPICTTNFSSAKELVIDNLNGFVLNERDEELFSSKMIHALNLPKDGIAKKANEIKKLSVSNLKEELLEYWNMI